MAESFQYLMIRGSVPTLQVFGSLESDVDIEFRGGAIDLQDDPE
jgi:hypothetical protein